MSKVLDVYTDALNRGKPYGVTSNDLRILIAREMGYQTPIDTIFHKDDEFTQKEKFEADFARLLKGEPVEYITNSATFLQHDLYVDNRVLIPRMETEELVANLSELICDYYDPRNYLVCADIGTGSGCIAIALRSLFPNWLISASDVSKDALEVAKQNADSYGGGINFLEGPSLKPYIEGKMNLDIIVSNPPYITNPDEVQDSVKLFEPHQALYLDKKASVYEEIFADYQKVKKGSLLMAFEIGYDLEDYLTELMRKYLKDYEHRFIKDLNGMTRFLFVYCR